MSDPRNKGWNPAFVKAWNSMCMSRCAASEKHGVANLIIPKNASSSIRYMLRPWRYVWGKNPRGHAILKKCRIVAVVRDPITRFVSSYGQLNKKRPGNPVARRLPFVKIAQPVDRFVQFVHDIDGNLYDFHLVPQTRCIADARVPVDEWLRFEHLTEDVAAMNARIGLKKTLKVWNTSKQPTLAKKLVEVLRNDAKLRGIVERTYAADMRLHARISAAGRKG